MQIHYHAQVAGFTKVGSLEEIQNWLDGIRRRVAGENLRVWRVVDCLVDRHPCISGPVSGAA